MDDALTSRIEREIFFRTFARTARAPDAVVQQFVEDLTEQQIKRGEVLFRAGDPSEHIYYIARGSMELSDPSGAAPWIFGGRSAVGAIDASMGQPYSRTAVALEDTLLLRMRIEDYFDILEDNFDFTKAMFGFLFGGVEELARPLAADLVYADGGGPTELGNLGRADGLGLVERALVLRASRPLAGIRLQVLIRLAQAASERRVAAGHALFEPGAGSSSLWLVCRGKIRGEYVGRDRPADDPFIADFGPGTMVLALAALAQAEASYRAVATEPTLVLGLAREDLWDVMEDHSDVVRAILAYAAGERARLQTIAADLAAGRTGEVVVAAPLGVADDGNR
ncbi:MAG TPA: cyclic nucleotide-binding domain-containing protein [Kofleriaceae bacterium]|nr:cyclic nucleotide-binding domain-containing protein [Kofleriaceae bacterium]